MSTEKDALQAMLDQFEANNKPKFEKKEKSENNVFNEKNYFTIYDLAKNEQGKTKEIRILPNPKGGSPIIEFHGHTAIVDGVKRTFPCLQHEKNTACPFCEAREVLLSSGDAAEKELAKKYKDKKMYIVKLIDRADEEHGPKFWRFNEDYNKKGGYDMIMGVVSGLKKNRNISDLTEGRDLSVIIGRGPKDVPIISSIVAQDSDVITEDKEKFEKWENDTRTWEDGIYSVKNYDYLAIIVRGYTPVWDKEAKCFVAKEMIDDTQKNEDATLDSELTMSVEKLKNDVSSKTESSSNEEESDDLPF